MSRFLQLLRKGPVLIYSLPRNDPELARAAVVGGAETLKVHLNVKHRASGTQFGSFRQEKDAILEILRVALPKNIPVGIVPGEEKRASLAEMRELLAMGIDFFDINWQYLDEELLNFPMGRVVSMTDIYLLYEPEIQTKILGCDAVEAALIPKESYGVAMGDFDLDRYKIFCEEVRKLRPDSPLPVIIPSQLDLTTLDVKKLLKIRPAIIRGVMLGAIVTGTDNLRYISQKLAAYRRVIDAAKRGEL